jgi:hypothetical protein
MNLMEQMPTMPLLEFAPCPYCGATGFVVHRRGWVEYEEVCRRCHGQRRILIDANGKEGEL